MHVAVWISDKLTGGIGQASSSFGSQMRARHQHKSQYLDTQTGEQKRGSRTCARRAARRRPGPASSLPGVIENRQFSFEFDGRRLCKLLILQVGTSGFAFGLWPLDQSITGLPAVMKQALRGANGTVIFTPGSQLPLTILISKRSISAIRILSFSLRWQRCEYRRTGPRMSWLVARNLKI